MTDQRSKDGGRPTAEEVLAAWQKWYSQTCPELDQVDDVEAALGRKGPEAEAEQWRSAVRRVVDSRTRLTERIAELDIANARLAGELRKIHGWLLRLAERAEAQAADTRFATISEAAAADAKNWRKTAEAVAGVLIASGLEVSQ